METYGLIGFPLGHSFSKKYFTEKFAREGISAQYLNFEIDDISRLQEILDRHPDLCGFNVTIPYKEKILPYLTAITPEAQEIGAVNVVKVNRHDGRLSLTGYNSDVIGFRESLRPFLQSHHTHALILGSGGASKAVRVGLHQLGIYSQTVSRTSCVQCIPYTAIDVDILQQYSVIINTTPLGMYPDIAICPSIPYEYLNEQHLLYDLVYNPRETLFMQKGRRQGATVCNGMEMLILQAEEAWRFWRE